MIMPLQNFLIVLIVCISVVFSKVTSKNEDLGTVIFSNVIFRHGHRTPTECYPNDPYRNKSFWPEGWGQLTNIGKNQEYELGKWLRERYQGLLSETYSRDEIYVLSTDVDRTLMSAEANLAGLYPPVESQRWNKDIKWQPIPVHTVPENLDFVLAMGFPCRKYREEYEKVFAIPAVKDFMASHKDLFDYLTVHTGERITVPDQVRTLGSTLLIESLHNYTLPDWTKKVYPQPLLTAGAYHYVLLTYTDTLKRLKSGPLLKDMLYHFKVKLSEAKDDDSEEVTSIKSKLLWLYSAHDETIATLLNSLGVFNMINPPFSSAVLVELREKNSEHFITVSFRNSSSHQPLLLSIPGCTELCPYQKFLHLTSDIISKDWKAECRTGTLFELSTELPYNSFAIFVMVTSTLLVFLLFISMSIFWQKQKSTRFYKKLKTDSI